MICIKEAKELLSQKLTSYEKVQIFYTIATAYSNLEILTYNKISFSEREDLQEKYIYYYRAALESAENIDTLVNESFFQQLYTNAGNAYSHVGRILEAMKLFDKALSNNFPMALANKGIAAFKLARIAYNKNHQCALDYYAHDMLDEALKNKDYLSLHGASFEDVYFKLITWYPPDFLFGDIYLGEGSFGDSNTNEKYRKWVSESILYLNELNNLVLDEAVAIDYINLSSIVYDTDNIKWQFHFGLFNQIIQEYVSARYLFYEGVESSCKSSSFVHPADYKVTLTEVDMNVTSHSDFCIRTAFKTLYSLFDRIAFFLNDYYDLGIGIRDISFRNIWKDKTKNHKSKLSDFFSKNFALYALYWLSKDIHEDNYKSTTKPSSKGIYDLRNKLEHRYVVSTLEEVLEQKDAQTHYISTVDLYHKTFELFYLAREAIIYLSFLIHIEEQNKKSSMYKNKNIGHVHVPIQKDEYK